MKSNILFSLLIVLGFVACSNAQRADGVIGQNISVEEFSSKINSLTNEQLVDVRTPGEWTEGTLKGAGTIDYYGVDFKEKVSKLDRNQPAMIYCRSGKRAGRAMNIMLDLGFKEVYNLSGGINAWRSKGLEIVR